MLRDLSLLSLFRQSHVDDGHTDYVTASDKNGIPQSNLGVPARSGPHRLTYRRDIDGLRAVAITAVFGYHLQISWLRGGFVGVDVFFVISGYLIGALILEETKHGTFSLAGFYARRIRRIVPAFAAMALAILALSYFLLLPSEYVRLAWSVVYSALSVSNIYFAHHVGYFDAPASGQILLHTWSLGVEEQFYLFFPLFVMLTLRYLPTWLNAGIVLVWVGSFLLSAYGAFADPQSTFFLAPGRAWELLLGTLVANQSWTTTLSRLTRNLIALLGLLMIGFAIAALTAETPFPGAAALVPCVGAALIIAAGQAGGSVVARALSLRPVVFVGLISYSLYLWHAPIIFFQRSDREVLLNGSRLLIVIYSVVIATLSWQFIEKPFRRRFTSTSNWKLVTGGLAGLGSLAAIAVLVVMQNGLPARFTPAARAYAAYLDSGQAHFREGTCFIVAPYTFSDFDRDGCLRREAGRKNYLLIGDSHAAQLWVGLSTLLPDVHILQGTTAGCRPEFTQAAGGVNSCTQMMKYLFTDYLVNNRVDRLLVAARWVPRDLPGLEEVLAWAKSRAIPVTVFGPMIEYDRALPRVLAAAAQSGDPGAADIHQVRNNTQLDDGLQAIAGRYGADYVSFYRLLCASEHCLKVAPDGAPLEFDTDHLTRQGSILVARKLVDSGQLR
jgi:peptidoglycan/LPS O-acetylase OafA/YrhL